MSAVRGILVNGAFTAVFLAGGALVWTGLRALVLGTGAVGRGPVLLAAGFAVWGILAFVSRRLTGVSA